MCCSTLDVVAVGGGRIMHSLYGTGMSSLFITVCAIKKN